MKRRLMNASLPSRLSPHSFRVAVITDLLEQAVALEDVQLPDQSFKNRHQVRTQTL
jgi:hypothetical protein